MKTFKKILACVMAVLVAGSMALSLTACSGEKDKLVMSTNAAFPPYEFKEGGGFKGIDVEIMTAIAEDMGLELKVEDMDFNSVIMAVTQGKADVAAAGLTITEDRKKNVDFTNVYAIGRQVIIVQNDSDIVDDTGLEGKSVGVQEGTTGDIYAEDIKDVDLQKYKTGFEAVQALTQGKVDAVIIDDNPAKEFVKKAEGVKILDKEFVEEEYAFAVNKGNTELLDKINASLKKLQDDGTVQSIIDTYINAN